MKKTIAFDLDDVIVDATGFWLQEVNRRTGSKLEEHHFKKPGNYWQYYENTWKEHGVDHLISISDIDEFMNNDQLAIEAHKHSIDVLKKLSKNYELHIVTARGTVQREATEKWVKSNFSNIFAGIHFADGKEGIKQKNKGQICKDIGASWLVDDNPNHCLDALDQGVTAILFSDMGWSHDAPDHLIRCKDWLAILEYFDNTTS